MRALKSRNFVFLLICNPSLALTISASPVNYRLDDAGLIIEGAGQGNPIIYDNDCMSEDFFTLMKIPRVYGKHSRDLPRI